MDALKKDPSNNKNNAAKLLLIVVFALFIMWILYTASINQTVRSSLDTSVTSQALTGDTATLTPESMPGMNH